MPSTPSLQHDRCIMHGPSTGAQRMRAVPLACLATLLAACSGNVRDTAPAGSAAHPVQPIEVPDVAHPQGETAAWWYRSGAARAAANGAMQGQAKNVIVFLGDGMSLTTVAAARILDGQRKGHPGEENQLAWETFPATALRSDERKSTRLNSSP